MTHPAGTLDSMSSTVGFPEGTELTFVASDPPRESFFLLWNPEDRGGLFAAGDGESETAPERVEVELVVPRKRGTHRVAVTGLRLGVASVIDDLVDLPATAPVARSVRSWAAVVRAALGLVARGRVLPTVSPEGWDAWRVDPLDIEDRNHMAALAAALPAAAHCTPVAKGRITEAEVVVKACFDAVADALVRSPAAELVCASPVFSARQPMRVRHLKPWATDVAAPYCAGAALVLQVHPPGSPEPVLPVGEVPVPDPDVEADLRPEPPPAEPTSESWQVVFQLQSREDPSLLITAENLWTTHEEVLARLGEQAEIELLGGLRRAAEICSPLGRALDDPAPTGLVLDDEDLDPLLDSLDDLAEAGIEVRWPADLVSPRITRRLIVSAEEPGDGLPSVTGLNSLLEVDWEFLLEGVPLTAEELDVLARAKMALVPLRGRWVRLDESARERLRARPPRVGAADVLAAALGAGLTLPVDPGDGGGTEMVEVDVRGAVAALAQRIGALDGEREEPEPPGLEAELRPYQRRGLAWMADLCAIGLGGCLADDMGLGKTVQLLALHALRGGPTLVVCPTSLMANWEREASRFVPGVRVHRFHGQGRELGEVGPGDLVVTSYGVVRTDAAALADRDWDLVVADEAQHAKNPRSRTAVALRKLNGTARLALTGTPVENRLSELWSIMDWAVPGLLGPLETFRRTLAIPIEREGNPAATAKLNSLVRPFLLRRRKIDPGIAPELPPKTERDVVVPLTAEQVSLYKATVSEALEELKFNEGISRHGLVLKMLTALKQITNHPAQFLGQEGPLAARSGKLGALDELVGVARAAGESTLVFTQYVTMGKLLVEHLRTRGVVVEMLHGSLGVKARQALVDRFQAGEIEVLVLSLKAGGTGLNLTTATQVIHYDRWWNPAVEDQATDRAYRIGQDRPVTVHRLVTEGTVEDKVARLLAHKRALAEKVIGTGEGWIGNLDDDDLAELVQLSDRRASGVESDGQARPGPDTDGEPDDDRPLAEVVRLDEVRARRRG